MNDWKRSFVQASLQHPEAEELELTYEIAAPATPAELSAVESRLGYTLPPSLRELLQEFNGVRAKDKYWGWQQLYFSTSFMLAELREYFADSENPLPPTAEMNRVVFFCQQNGMGILFGVVASSFNEFNEGQIVSLESDTGEFEYECESLSEFVENSEFTSLG